MSSSMTSDDREALSALFDGELEGDAARFALRRLDHDAGWRDACSRWQLAGDVMRGQSMGLAPRGFAQRISEALAEEATPLAAVAGEVRRTPASGAAQARSRRWWGRAALAASVAMAALFVTDPFSRLGSGDEAGSIDAPLAAIPAATDSAAPSPLPPVSDAAPASAAGAAEVAVATVAAAQTPRRVAERRTPSRVTAVATNARPDAEAPATVALAAEPTPRTTAPAAGNPFKPQVGDLVTRPWPRALLPDSSAAGAFTARFGTNSPSPSFYPFEPDVAHAPAANANAANANANANPQP
ncbi:sigma-E factor negative regulatory protein [Aerolutibacter ruishenii]|uniref:Negative regulator of sigma E activity n=1 Tax=Aerolutibacter ruishenii TaxID=686800 RepID=A0A562LGR1_9GAMM|nr:sigma-E factor negative regulatory protein [Lysobacter ruishenii]TWI06785.1 negative regulator of sigma E activity [Lysobacter ruishenii]